MIERSLYIGQLKEFIGMEQIKILTGIRRSGKSTVLQLLKEELLKAGKKEKQIVYINLESMAYSGLKTAQHLYEYVVQKTGGHPKPALLIDEIQEVMEWEKAVNSFVADYGADVYLTGSNSHLLSSELATYLAGRYVEIPIYTLSYTEYLQFRMHYFPDSIIDAKETFTTYLRLGGFPVIHTARYSGETAYKVVYDIYSSVILRDTVQRYKIRDIELLERIVRYVFDNIGNTFSGKSVADYFKNQQRKTDLNTVYNYLYALEGAFVVYRIPRYDIRGKEILKTQEKYYLADASLLYAVMGYCDRLIAGVLENLVFLELKRRGYRVYVGKLDHREIDFIAEKLGKKIYVQVAYKLETEQTVEREFGTLLAVNDQYPKYVVTMDELWKETVGGIRHFYISDFLLDSGY